MILPISLGLGGQSYLIPVAGGRYPVELVEVCKSWLGHHGHKKKSWPLKLGVRKLGTMDKVVFFLKQKHRGIWTFLQRPFKTVATLWHFICTFADYT